MNKDFSRIITHLRKKKGLSQKQASADLGISQALLSHYEKGIRECGLDFLVKTADYYEVSVDYLLGRTPNQDGSKINPEDIADVDEAMDIKQGKTDNYCLINRKILTNSTGVLYNILSNIGNKRLSKYISQYLMTSLYFVIRIIYSLNEKNPVDTHSIPYNLTEEYCQASMSLDLIKIKELSSSQGEKLKADLSPESLSSKYPESYSSFVNLMSSCEKNITQKFRL